MLGRDKIPIPADDAAPEEWAKVYDRLGRPEKPDGYSIPDDYKDSVDAESTKAFFERAHALGLNRKQAAELIHFEVSRAKQAQELQHAAMSQKAAEVEAELKAEWGHSYHQRFQHAVDAIRKFAGPNADAVIEGLKGGALGNDVNMLRFIANVGRAMVSDPIQGRGMSADIALSPDEARSKIRSLQADPAFSARWMKGEASAKAEMAKLYKVAYPE